MEGWVPPDSMTVGGGGSDVERSDAVGRLATQGGEEVSSMLSGAAAGGGGGGEEGGGLQSHQPPLSPATSGWPVGGGTKEGRKGFPWISQATPMPYPRPVISP